MPVERDSSLRAAWGVVGFLERLFARGGQLESEIVAEGVWVRSRKRQ